MTLHTLYLGKYRGAARHIAGEPFQYWVRAKLRDGRELGPWRVIPGIVALPVVARTYGVDVVALVYVQNDLPAGEPAKRDSNAVWYKQV